MGWCQGGGWTPLRVLGFFLGYFRAYLMQRGLALVVFKRFWTRALYNNCVGHPMQNQCKAHATPILYPQDTDSIHRVWVWHGPTWV